MIRRAVAAGVLAVAWLASAPLYAVSVESWSASTAEELARGTLDGTALDEDGRIRLAPQLQTLWGPEPGVVWGVQPAGRLAAFVALSAPGRLLRVENGRPAELWYAATEESLVTSLASDGKGEVFFGLSPEGSVLRARAPRDARFDVAPVLQTESLFVWALQRGADGALWIGTGAPGRLLRQDRDGTTKELFTAGDDPVRSIALLPGGGAVIGTGGRGRVVRIGADGRAFVLLDADETEIVSVAVADDGTVFALAARGAKQPRPSRPTDPSAGGGEASASIRVVAKPPPQPGDEAKEAAPQQPPTPPTTPPTPALVSQPGGALYRLDPNGDTRKIWQSIQEMPFAMVRAGTERLLVSTGDGGRVHALDAEGRATRLLRVASDQASAMAAAEAGQVLIGGTTDARVELLLPGPRAHGSYLGPVIDAGTVADWGRLRWQAELPAAARLQVQARSGNTAEPDDTWSPWTDLRGATDGSGVADVPAARWFQLKCLLFSKPGAAPAIDRLEVTYQPRNRAPRVDALTVEAAGVVWVRGPTQSSFFSGPAVTEDPVSRKASSAMRRAGRTNAIRRTYEAGARTFSWDVVDPDGDRLRAAIEVRREGTADWFPLVQELDDTFFSWDARGVPDGLYRVRLAVDDALDNANGTHRRTERVSDAFLVDNTRPSIAGFEARRTSSQYEVRFTAKDPGGSVAAVEVAIDGAPWTPLTPLDGVADSEEEQYRFVLPRERSAGGALILRVTDAAGNLGGEMRRVGPSTP